MGICRTIAIWLASFLSDLGDVEIIGKQLENPVRKLAHFSEYAGLGFFLQLHMFFVRHLKIGIKNKDFSAKQYIICGIVISILYAISDELHQYFVPGRACRFLDVCIDSSGVLVGSMVFYLIFRRLLDGVLIRVYNET